MVVATQYFFLFVHIYKNSTLSVPCNSEILYWEKIMCLPNMKLCLFFPFHLQVEIFPSEALVNIFLLYPQNSSLTHKKLISSASRSYSVCYHRLESQHGSRAETCNIVNSNKYKNSVCQYDGSLALYILRNLFILDYYCFCSEHRKLLALEACLQLFDLTNQIINLHLTVLTFCLSLYWFILRIARKKSE